MTEQEAPAWQSPAEPLGPAPGIAFAGFGERLLAYIIDALIVGAIVTVLSLLLAAPFIGMMGGDPNDLSGGQIAFIVAWALIIAVATIGYFPWFWARSGATPGMKAMGLRVVRDADGGPISVGQALLRLVGYWVSGLVFYLGYIWIFIDNRRRGWHDLIAGTLVVKSR
jgi:uncharacterized RDD family membrane protein YckC